MVANGFIRLGLSLVHLKLMIRCILVLLLTNQLALSLS